MTTTLQPLPHCVLRTAGLSSANSAKFGPVRRNPDGSVRNHQGVDLAADVGTDVLAVSDGVIERTEIGANGYGWTITLKTTLDGQRLYAFYAHLSKIKVFKGDKVAAGQVIGLTGATGNAKGLASIEKGGHLHFELRTEVAPGLGLTGRIDPLPYIELDK